MVTKDTKTSIFKHGLFIAISVLMSSTSVLYAANEPSVLPALHIPTTLFKIEESNSTAKAIPAVIAQDKSDEKKSQGAGDGIIKNTFDRIATVAKDLIGTKYKFGGASPTSGFDCSGFVKYVFNEGAQLKLPRSSREMRSIGESVDIKSLEPGDLIFFKLNNSHVGIYIGNNKFIHAPSKGRSVSVDNIMGSFFKQHFIAARRVISTDIN